MKQLTILFTLAFALTACKKSKEENKNTSELKVLITSPVDNSTVIGGNKVQFAWFSSTNVNSVRIYHKIKIAEIIGNQSPDQALLTNKPFFEKDSLKELHVIIPETDTSPGLVIGKRYSWIVTASQAGLTSTGGESKVSTFTVVR